MDGWLIYNNPVLLIKGSLEVKLPTIWRVEKQSREVIRVRRWKVEKRSRVRRKKIQLRERQKKLESREMLRFFHWFVVRLGRKVGPLKRRVRSHVFRGDMKNCTALWREAHFQVKMYKTHQGRTTFGSCDVKKWTFATQNVKKLTVRGHFWKLGCGKLARRCGAKHISLSKCAKHTTFRPVLEVSLSKNGPPLWHEAHFQVKMLKTWRFRAIFWSADVEKWCDVVARSTFASQNVQNTCVLEHFWRLRCRKGVRQKR